MKIYISTSIASSVFLTGLILKSNYMLKCNNVLHIISLKKDEDVKPYQDWLNSSFWNQIISEPKIKN